jgi:DNA-binding response OmpR family regulator
VSESRVVSSSHGGAPVGTAWRASLDPRLYGLRIATIERDEQLLGELAVHVEELGWRLMAQRQAITSESILGGRPHALLVDVALLGPRWDAWLVRQHTMMPDAGIIVCTGHSSVKQRMHGLRAGADDWVNKPCAVEELAARLLAVVRAHRVRAGARGLPTLSSVGLEVRADRFDALVDDRPAGLTRREFEVLLCLASAAGEPLERDQIYREVWGHPRPQGDRALDTTVRKIRVKLALLAPDRTYVQTDWGVGYRFAFQRARQRRAEQHCEG